MSRITHVSGNLYYKKKIIGTIIKAGIWNVEIKMPGTAFRGSADTKDDAYALAESMLEKYLCEKRVKCG